MVLLLVVVIVIDINTPRKLECLAPNLYRKMDLEVDKNKIKIL